MRREPMRREPMRLEQAFWQDLAEAQPSDFGFNDKGEPVVLSPAGKAFVDATVELQPIWDEVLAAGAVHPEGLGTAIHTAWISYRAFGREGAIQVCRLMQIRPSTI